MTRDVAIEKAPEYVEWLINFLGAAWVHRAVADYSAHPVRAHFRVGCHALVPGLAAYEDWQAAGHEALHMPDDALEIAGHSVHIPNRGETAITGPRDGPSRGLVRLPSSALPGHRYNN